MHFLFVLFLAITTSTFGSPLTPEIIATDILAPLLDPVKIATLKGDRPVNSRLYKVLYWVEFACTVGGDVSFIIDRAQVTSGYQDTQRAKADKIAIISNRKKLQDYGCFTKEGMERLRKGQSPQITKGSYAGSSIALDHVLPRSVVPELDARFFNLEVMPAEVNLKKAAIIGDNEVSQGRRWNQMGLLSFAGLEAIERSNNQRKKSYQSN